MLFSLTGFYLFASPTAEDTSAAETSGMPEKTVPESKEQLYYSFSGVAKQVLPVVVEINTVELIEQTIPSFSNPFDFFFRGPKGNNEEGEKENIKDRVLDQA